MIREADRELKKQWMGVFDGLPPNARDSLKQCLLILREYALNKANHSWKKHKAPMALYWKVVGVYSGHLARAIKLSTTHKPETL